MTTQLINEAPAKAEVRTEKGIPRLYINGDEVYPMLGWSWNLAHSTPFFRRGGVDMLHPVFGLNAAWLESGAYDWSEFDDVLENLFTINPDAYFLPRVLLDVPEWWKDAHPDELIKTAIPVGTEDNERYHTTRLNPEGGWHWGIHMKEPSYASDLWLNDMTKMFRAFLKHFEDSPFRSRLIGYQIGGGIYGEWHYFLSEFMPDSSEPMRRHLGFVPDEMQRLSTSFGLLRDPQREKAVIDYCRKFHESNADVLLKFARLAKEETGGRVIIGAFNCYLLENVWIHDGGHLAPQRILESSDIDFLASPYTYQTTNDPDRPDWEHDIFDDAGNRLGRARGIGGDGGYRVLLDSAQRHGKLFLVELDASTFLQPDPVPGVGEDYEMILARIGGEGRETVEGTRQILRRDLGQVFVNGNGGWLFDFGPLLHYGKSWYGDDAITDEVKRFTELGKQRAELDMKNISRIAAVYDAKSYYVTQHWKAEEPFTKGADCVDFFTNWHLDSQARAIHRIGAPASFLYRFDIDREDAKRYKLFLMMNLFYLTDREVDSLLSIFENSGATVVWCYAPGFVAEDKLDPAQMERLAGFRFRVDDKPGPMMIRSTIKEVPLEFGTKRERFPRFQVIDDDVEILGEWADNGMPAFAWKRVDGWNSVYAGTAPLPVDILRWLAERAGARLWSSREDIVRASKDATMIVATEEGRRRLTLDDPQYPIDGGRKSKEFELDLKKGDVYITVSRPAKREI